MAFKELSFHNCACLTYCYGVDEIIKYNVGETSNGIMFVPSSVKISPLVWKLQEGTDSTGIYFLTLRKESRIKKYHYMRIQCLCTWFSHWLSLRDQYTITYSTRSFPHPKQTNVYEIKTRCAYQKNVLLCKAQTSWSQGQFLQCTHTTLCSGCFQQSQVFLRCGSMLPQRQINYNEVNHWVF